MNFPKKLLTVFLILGLLLNLSGCSIKANSKGPNTLKPEDVVDKFMSSTTLDDESSYLLDASEYKEKVKKEEDSKKLNSDQISAQNAAYYINNLKPRIIFTNLDSDKTVKIGDWVRVRMSYNNDSELKEENILIFYLKSTENGYKIDRFSTFGINSEALKQFKIDHPDSAMVFKVYASLSDSYFDRFRDAADEYYSVSIQDTSINNIINGDDITTLLDGYISKNSRDGKTIYEILKDGKKHAITLELQFDPLNHDRILPSILINKVVSTSWYVN